MSPHQQLKPIVFTSMTVSVSFSGVGMTVSTPVVTATPPLDLRRRVGDGVTSLEVNRVIGSIDGFTHVHTALFVWRVRKIICVQLVQVYCCSLTRRRSVRKRAPRAAHFEHR